MRMFVLDGGKLSYYQLGETEPKGHLMLHLIRKGKFTSNLPCLWCKSTFAFHRLLGLL